MDSKCKTLALLLTLLFLLPLITFQPLTVKASPKTLIVPYQYSDIQSAVGNASAGDTVYVKSGNYNLPLGGLFINKPLTLIGENKQNTVIVNPYDYNFWNQQVIQVYSENVSISGFTIKSSISHHIIGVYILAEEPSRCEITDNIITENGFFGIAKTGQLIPSFDLISGNEITQNEAGVSIQQSSNIIISNNTISNNQNNGLLVSISKNLTIIENEFIDNSQGGISISGYGPFLIQTNEIKNSNVGITFERSSNSSIYRNNIINNSIGIKLKNYGLYNYSSTIYNPSTISFYIKTGTGNYAYSNNFSNSVNVLIETVYPFNITESGKIGNGTDSVLWDDGKTGNYWSDYNGVDSYRIDANNIDHHPLTQPVYISTATPTPNIYLAQSLFQPLIISIIIIAGVTFSLVLFRRHRKTANLKQ